MSFFASQIEIHPHQYQYKKGKPTMTHEIPHRLNGLINSLLITLMLLILPGCDEPVQDILDTFDDNPSNACNNDICEEGEDCTNCEADCGACEDVEPVCGDGECNGDEDCSSCEADCGREGRGLAR